MGAQSLPEEAALWTGCLREPSGRACHPSAYPQLPLPLHLDHTEPSTKQRACHGASWLAAVDCGFS